MKRWKKRRFKRTIKELSQFDNKKSEELESEFDNFDADYSYPISPFKGRNIVDLDMSISVTGYTEITVNWKAQLQLFTVHW